LTEAASLWEELGEKRNETWCRANIQSNQALTKLFKKNYEGAIKDYGAAANIFDELSDQKSKALCEANILICKANIVKRDNRFFKASQLEFKASNLLRDAGIFDYSLKTEAQAWIDLALFDKRNAEYEKALHYFQIASKICEAAGDEQKLYWCVGNLKECSYFLAKSSADIEGILQNLPEAISAFEKAKDESAVAILKGNLSKYEGLLLKRKGMLGEALNKFIQSSESYSKAAELLSGISSAELQQQSVLYSEALKLNTQADIDFLINLNLIEAAKNYVEASNLFRRTGDERSVKNCGNLHILCTALNKALKGRFEEAKSLWSKASPDFLSRIPKNPPKDLTSRQATRLISTLTKLIIKQAEVNIKEIIELDKGPALESRVRELIRQFDGRKFLDKDGNVFNISKEFTLTLHKYDTIEEKNIKPQDDEIGIVFENRTPINIDILATRVYRNRSYLLICECKQRPRRETTEANIQLLLKKAKFIQTRYNKIAVLAGRYKPEIEEIWFVSIGGFTANALAFAKKSNVKTINELGLNILLKEFSLFPVKNPQSIGDSSLYTMDSFMS